MLGDAFQADVDKALDAQLDRPLAPPKPPTRFKDSVWAQPIRGLAAGLGDMLAGGSELAVGMYRQSRAMDTQDPDERKRQAAQGVPFDGATDFSRDLRKVAAGYRPDPATAGAAENIVFGLSRVIPKAIGYTLAGGPVAGAAALGVDEALTTFDELTGKGVDKATADKVALVTGVAAGAGIVLPMAGSTVGKTAGLYLAGGPGAFVAQQQATREILQRANYSELAKQYDPLDPTGLAISALIPLPFAAWGVRGNVKGAKAVEPPAPRIEPTLEPEQIDATMVHNLTLARDVHDSTPLNLSPTTRETSVDEFPAVPWIKGADLAGKNYDELDQLHTRAVDHNKAVDLEGIRRFFGEERAAEAAEWTKRKRENWLMKNETDESSDWMQARYMNDELIAEHRSAVNSFDSEDAASLGRSIAVRARNIDEPGFFETADGVAVANGLKFAKENGWNLDEVLGAMRGRAAEWAGDDAAELFARMFKPAKGASTPPPVIAQIEQARTAAQDLVDSGKPLAEFAADGKFAPDVQNLLLGIHEAGADGARVARMLSDFQRTTDAQPGRAAVDIAADVVEASRAGGEVTPAPKAPEAAATTPEKAAADSITNRLAELEKAAPNMVVRIADDGTPVTLADELAAIRREAAEGTDSTLGSNDAPLLQVAAECALSQGAG